MEKNGKANEDKHTGSGEKKTMPIFAKYGIIALAAIVVIVAGLLIYFNAAGGYVAKIGNEKISTNEFKFYLTVQKQSMLSAAQSLDPNVTEETFWNTKIGGENALDVAKKNTLDNLRDLKIQLLKAKGSKIALTSDDIKNIDSSIKTNYIDSQQIGGGNRVRANQYFMNNYGFSLDDLRKAQMDSVLASRFQTEEVKKINATEADIKTNYEKHPEWYKEDTQMRIGGEEAVWAREILIKADKNAAQDVKDAAKKKAQDLLDKANAGADFATLAKENSEDGNAQYGGDYLFGKNKMVPEFETATFSLNPGQIYATPVQTEFGFHVIKLEEKYAKDQPVSLKNATEYREFGVNFLKYKMYQEKLKEWEKDPQYKIEQNTAEYNAIK